MGRGPTVPAVLFKGVGRQVDGVALAARLGEPQVGQGAVGAHPGHLQLWNVEEQHKKTFQR